VPRKGSSPGAPPLLFHRRQPELYLSRSFPPPFSSQTKIPLRTSGCPNVFFFRGCCRPFESGFSPSFLFPPPSASRCGVAWPIPLAPSFLETTQRYRSTSFSFSAGSTRSLFPSSCSVHFPALFSLPRRITVNRFPIITFLLRVFHWELVLVPTPPLGPLGFDTEASTVEVLVYRHAH